MTRIPEVPAAHAGWLTKLIYRYSVRRYGAVPQPIAVLARHRGLLLAYGLAEATVEKAATKLPAGVRDLAVYRTATKIGCPWCVDFGTMLQQKAGLDINRLRDIDNYRTSPHFTELDRLVIDYADAMTNQPMTVTDEQVAQLTQQIGREQTLELTFMIAQENLRSRLNHALGMTNQGFTTGKACTTPMPQ